MGFKNAWKLVSINSPLLGINKFFLQIVSDSYKEGRNQENKKNGDGLLLGDERASTTLLHAFNNL